MSADAPIAKPASAEALIGHEAAEQRFLNAFASGRLHHGWLIGGPQGIGKATLAYRIARFLLAVQKGGLFAAEQATSLALAADSSVFRQVAAGSHPDLRVIERGINPKTGQPKTEIAVDDVRALSGFLGSTSAMGGWRVVIVDAADEMNRNAANAILKMLEEPPVRTVFLVVSHAPGRLLPTIRSRCLSLTLKPLTSQQVETVIAPFLPAAGPAELADLALLSDGSPGLALALAEGGGAEIYATVRKLLSSLPKIDMSAVHGLADTVSRGRKSENALATFTTVLERSLADSVRAAADPARHGAAAPWAAHLPLGRWLSLRDHASALLGRAAALNLEPRHVVLSLFATIAQAA